MVIFTRLYLYVSESKFYISEKNLIFYISEKNLIKALNLYVEMSIFFVISEDMFEKIIFENDI